MKIVLLLVFIFLVSLILIAYFIQKKLIKTSNDFFLAGRNLSFLFVAVSLFANNIGGASTVGVIDKAYGNWGFSSIWYILAASIGIIPLALFSYRMRKAIVFTIPEVIGRRFGVLSQLLASIFNVISLILLTSSQLLVTGLVVNTLTGFPIKISIVIAAFTIIGYLLLGGMWADVFTDLIEFLMIFLGFFAVLIFFLKESGGITPFINSIPKEKLALTSIGAPMIFSLILQYFFTFMTGPEIVSRIFASKDSRTAIRGVVASSILMAIFSVIPAFLGLMLFAHNPNLAGGQFNLLNVIGESMPPLLLSLFLIAILSATISSADTNLISASTIITKDLHSDILKIKMDDRKMLRIARLSTVAMGFLAMAIAFFQFDIIRLNIFAFMLRSAGPFAAFTFAFVFKKPSKNSGLFSIIAGSLIGALWIVLNNPFGILPIVAGAVASILVFLTTTFIETVILKKESAPPLIR